MKRFSRVLCSLMAGSALLFAAQAADLPSSQTDILQSAISSVQQEWQESGTIRTTDFSGGNCSVQISELLPKKHLYKVQLSVPDEYGSRSYRYGVLNPQTGTLIVPAEYDAIEALPSGEMLLHNCISAPTGYWFADETGALTQIVLPDGYTDLLPDTSGLFILSKLVQKPVYNPTMPEGPGVENVAQYAIADRNMHIIRENIDGGGSSSSILPPLSTNGLFIIQTGSTQWESHTAYSGCNGTFGLMDLNGNFVGRHDYRYLAWADQHFVARRGEKYYLLDGKGGETPVSVNMEMYRYSDWAKNEVAAAGLHDLTIQFDYPALDITRANFTALAMKLYHAINPDKEIETAGEQFSDCGEEAVAENVQQAAALGIVTGYTDGTFRPYHTISHQEAAAMLSRLYRALGGKESLRSEQLYADDSQFGGWARDSIYQVRQLGVMQGRTQNKFYPADGYTAEQAIVTMERLYQALQ